MHRSRSRSRSRSGRVVLAAVASVTAAAVGAACGGSEASATEEGDQPYVKIVNVETVTVGSRPFSATIRITGEARPETDVTVSAEESGILRRFVADKGARVGRGAAIARIEDAVLGAQAEEARAMAELANDRYTRQRRLWEEEGIGSEIAYLQAKSESESAAARHQQLQARLARTVIRSPVAGTVDDHLVEAGEVVQPGTAVARVVDAANLKVAGGVPERFAREVATGDSAAITFDVFPGQVFDGRIAFVGTAVDRQSRTFPIEIVMDNPEGLVKPYMIANVRIVTRRIEDALVVPREVLLRTELGQQAMVVESREGGDVAVARAVALGPSNENEVVVTEGLQAGDRLIVKGQQMVAPGDRVREVGGRDAEAGQAGGEGALNAEAGAGAEGGEDR
ncbi:MAG: efflux RND transporter periplasmic adaptor subunit [Gemmatimonadota bacterium]